MNNNTYYYYPSTGSGHGFYPVQYSYQTQTQMSTSCTPMKYFLQQPVQQQQVWQPRIALIAPTPVNSFARCGVTPGKFEREVLDEAATPRTGSQPPPSLGCREELPDQVRARLFLW